MKPGWRRVNKAHPCPVCARPNAEHTSTHCIVAIDDTAAICPFTPEGAKRNLGVAGYLHHLGGDRDGHSNGHNGRVHSEPKGERAFVNVVDWASLAIFYERAASEHHLIELSAELGVSVGSLRRLRAGLAAPATWAFPMVRPHSAFEDKAAISGIRIRHETGKKWSVVGTKDGLFVPRDLGEAATLLVCEGPTDTAAMLDLGFAAIGRSNCHPWSELIAPLAKGRRTIIVADNDEVGRGGASALAAALREHSPDVRIVSPPAGVKDARAWKRAGLTREQLLEAAYGNGNNQVL